MSPNKVLNNCLDINFLWLIYYILLFCSFTKIANLQPHDCRLAEFKLNIKNKQIERIDTTSQGASWDGETLTLTRLIQNVAVKHTDGTYAELPYENILWEYFTLQDAVDFARYAVETTIKTMHFKNVIETVGGSVDILVITPDKTMWLQKETLK